LSFNRQSAIGNRQSEGHIATTMPAIIPIPRIPITVRPGRIDDLPFIDALQRAQTKQVGWMPTKQIEQKLASGQVLIAEEEDSPQRHGGTEAGSNLERASVSPCLRGEKSPVGYVIASDRYFKRDDVGIVYQLNVVPGKRRSLVGATLLKAQFERSAYGCRLYCCWCAQDIEANRFWEAMGFVPLAFRAGSRGRGRVHIFWQRRIRAGDAATPYWFPAQTTSGAIREDRLVLPIPPGARWCDPMPIVLPQSEPTADAGAAEPKRLPGKRTKVQAVQSPPEPKYGMGRSKLHFAPPKPAETPKQKPPREKRKAVKNDPRLVAAARELRDRWLERVNAEPAALVSQEKYKMSRAVTDQGTKESALPVPVARQLPSAA
jgi:hypothetical protein